MEDLKFKTRARGNTNWISDGDQITSKANIEMIKGILENVGSIIIEHWHFYGASAPSRAIFDDLEDFTEYLSENAIAGDSIHVWSMQELCNDSNQLVYGKCPDEKGQTPVGGAY